MGEVIQLPQRHATTKEWGAIQDGANMVTDYLEEPRIQLVLPSSGYSMRRVNDIDDQLYAPGREGVKDFATGFREVIRLDRDISVRSGVAYGAYYAGKLVLPNVLMPFDQPNEEFENLVKVVSRQCPEPDFPVIAEAITTRAAATLTLLALWSKFKFSQDERSSLTGRILAGKFPPAEPNIASAFKNRLPETKLLPLLKKPIPTRLNRV
ncbi:hypothetical protein HY003_01925 [Candidatus Saccharibacteria bacterium]|nr:hypothetical protein [Candidatus Saccharibacteria bacterium]MBI3338034.1 hypothetical protein [Candidatus Saccharibacteria bacterium]